MDYAANVQAAHGFGGAFASARVPGDACNSTIAVPGQYDFQMDGH